MIAAIPCALAATVGLLLSIGNTSSLEADELTPTRSLVQVTEQQLASRTMVEEGCRQRQAEASAARAKNWGSFVIG